MDKISIYNPFLKAYSEVSIEDAKKFIESAKEAEEKIVKAKKDNGK